jgi:DNA-binding SARP family transcriptional activator
MTVLHISLFGELHLTYHRQIITSINTPRLQSLLAYLLLHRQAPLRRQELGYRFWPDSTEAQARTNLRNLIHLLRRALPDVERFIYSDTLTLQWRSDAPYTLDVEQFEGILDEASRAKRQGNTTGMRNALEQAIEFYRGELLTGCYDEWIIPERERLLQRLLIALTELIDLLEQERAYSEAVTYLQHLIRIDPLRETAYQRLMQVHLLLGERASALRVYYSATTTIARELGVEPGQPLHDTYIRLLRGHERDASDTTSDLQASTTIPLVGRRHEWAQLQAAWRRARQSGPQLVILWGEAGIGKTRLAEELFNWVQRLGYSVASTRCYTAEGDLPYAPIASWIRSDALRRTWPQLPQVWLQEVSRIVPEIGGEQSPGAAPQPLREAWQRKRLFEGLAHAVTLAREQQLLSIDDLQWCDQDSLDWLHYLLRFKHDTALLIVATARREDPQLLQRMLQLLAVMRQQALVTEIELPPLSQAETADLATHLIAGPLDPVHLAQLYRESEGNPLFIVELARVIGKERDRTIPDAIIRLPPRVHAVLSARLSQLSPVALELAGLAATVGRDFSFALLQRASDMSEAELVRGLDELWQHRIIREQPGSTTAYAFSHDKLREVSYGELSLSRRQLWHRRIAAALETAHANRLDMVAGQIALHCELGGLWEQAVVYYERTASIARAIYANGEGISTLQHALMLFKTNVAKLSDQKEPTAVRLHTQLGEILY